MQIPNFLLDEAPMEPLQAMLDCLSVGKIGWEGFLAKVRDLSSFSRLNVEESGRSLLHLAVLDGKIDVVKALSTNPFMKQKRDKFGLSPLELAQFLGEKEMLAILDPYVGRQNVESPVPIEMLHSPVFATKEILHTVLHATAKAKKEDLIPSEKIWMGVYFDKEIQKGIHPPISIRHIDDELGFGVFAEKKILPCSFVGEYTGLVQEHSRKAVKGKKYILRYTLWGAKRQFIIDAEKKGNFTRFINHSSNPNLGLQSVYWRGIPRMILVALKEIEAGAQLTFDYGALFWQEFDQVPQNLSQ